MGRGPDPQSMVSEALQPRGPGAVLCTASRSAGQWLFLDPREGWIPRELGLACSQRCLEL